MSNVKAQGLKQRLGFFSTLTLASTLDFLNLTLNLDIHLAFACLPYPPQARTLTFGFGLLIFLVLFGDDLKKLLLGVSTHQSLFEGRFFQQGDNATQEL